MYWEMKKRRINWWWRRVTGTLVYGKCLEPDCFFKLTTDSYELRERVMWAHYRWHDDKKKSAG